jgi:hypothetical protein
MIEYELNFRQQFTDINPIPTKTTEHHNYIKNT